MKTKILLLALFTLFFLQQSIAQENIRFKGYVRNYSGVLMSDNHDFSIMQNTFNLEIEKRAEKIGFKVNPYLYHFFDKELELGLREAYLDMYFGKFDLRVGKQQIIYGKADGVFITDVVSPKDLREFLLPDFEEIRIGVTSAKLNYYIGNNTFEFVWIPVFTPTHLPDSGSIWRPKMNFPITPTFDNSTSGIKPRLENSELFFRYSAMTSKIDFELVGGYFFNDDPAMHLTKYIDPVNMQLIALTARPQYHRLTMGGGSFSTPLNGFVIRGEGGYYSGKYFQTQNPAIPDATIKKNYLHYMAGLDYTIAGVRLSAQFIQEYILNYENGIWNDEFENTMTFLAKKDFLREKLWLELFTYIGLNKEDALIRPKISYSFADGFDMQFGANIFTGTEGRFGQYNNNDMLYLKLKYSF
ncbi:MAG: DUF1302 family protein [Bacteroidales bacterium]|nr:DUF1302 family protein [Bacteroidales bacterium]